MAAVRARVHAFRAGRFHRVSTHGRDGQALHAALRRQKGM